jgi:RNA polymerase sigma-70 factor (ECF subfamily)
VLHARGPDFEDHVQGTFERILRGLAEDRFARRSSLKTWACAIASHVALDALRRTQRERGRSAELPEQDVLPSGPSSDSKIESLNELRRVQRILSDMNADLAETLILHDVLGHKLSEISSMRDATQSATQSRLHRARMELKRRATRPIGKGPIETRRPR